MYYIRTVLSNLKGEGPILAINLGPTESQSQFGFLEFLAEVDRVADLAYVGADLATQLAGAAAVKGLEVFAAGAVVAHQDRGRL